MTANYSRYSPSKMFGNMEDFDEQRNRDLEHGLNAPEMENEKRYDISQVLLISRGDDGFVRSLIKMFVVQTPIYIDKIFSFYEAGDYKSMGEIAHQLKQSIYAMGINELKKTVFQIVHAGRTEMVSENFGQHLTHLRQTADLVIEDLKHDFNI